MPFYDDPAARHAGEFATGRPKAIVGAIRKHTNGNEENAINASLLDMVKGIWHFLVQLANSPLWKSIIVFVAVILLLGGAILSIFKVVLIPFAIAYILCYDYAKNSVKERVVASARMICTCLVLLGVAALCIYLIHFPVSWL